MSIDIEKLLDTQEPADLGPGPRAGVMSESGIRQAAEGCPDAVLALVLLWHDHHVPAHVIAQATENRDGSYVHAILHRREPDYGNARYWFRRVGVHPAYAELGRRAGELLEARGEGELASALLPGGRWDAMAFVDACEAAAFAPRERQAVLREIQRIEFAVLGRHLAHP